MAEPLFNASRRARQRNLAGATLFLAGTLPFMAGLLMLDAAPRLEKSHWGTLLSAALMCLAALLLWSLQGRMALLGNAELRREVRRRLGADADGEFVGFSAGGQIRSWEGETDQDVGFLTVIGDTLIYHGDRYSWSLPRAGVDDIRLLVLGEEVGQTLTPLRVAVYWHGHRDPGRTFTVASRADDNLAATNRSTRRLAEQLLAWWRTEAPASVAAAAPAPWLGLPPTDLRGSFPAEQPAPGSCLSALALSVIASAMLWQTSWDLVQRGDYNRAVLWAGLILMGAIVFTAHFLAYLQVHQGRVDGPM